MTLDILAIGAHPDDVELGCAASLAGAARAGLAVGVVDLTRGERSTNGTPEERTAEAGEAARVLGLVDRWNAGLPDRGISCGGAQVGAMGQRLAQLRPRLLLAPWWGDRHPDHRAAARLVSEAAFEAGLLAPAGVARGPAAILFYFINDTPPFTTVPAGLPALPPPAEACGSLVLVPADEAAYALKRQAVAAHRSQFGGRAGDRPTPLNNGETMRRVEARDAYFGSLLGADRAEGFTRAGPWRVGGLGDLLA